MTETRGDPREVGDLLATWVGIRMEEIDDLAAEARTKADAIPDRRALALLVGELALRVHCLELEVQELRKVAKR